MTKTAIGVRTRILWGVNYEIEELTRKATAYESVQQSWSGLGIKQAWASFRLAQLRPKIMWWNEIKTSIESDEPSRAMPALERLIRHYRQSNLWFTYFGLLSSTPGFALNARALVLEQILKATELQEHYRHQAA